VLSAEAHVSEHASDIVVLKREMLGVRFVANGIISFASHGDDRRGARLLLSRQMRQVVENRCLGLTGPRLMSVGCVDL
jgi:hypothetical protein